MISISFQINERKSVIPSRVHWIEIEGIQNGLILVSDLDLSSLKIAVFEFIPLNLEIMQRMCCRNYIDLSKPKSVAPFTF